MISESGALVLNDVFRWIEFSKLLYRNHDRGEDHQAQNIKERVVCQKLWGTLPYRSAFFWVKFISSPSGLGILRSIPLISLTSTKRGGSTLLLIYLPSALLLVSNSWFFLTIFLYTVLTFAYHDLPFNIWFISLFIKFLYVSLNFLTAHFSHPSLWRIMFLLFTRIMADLYTSLQIFICLYANLNFKWS